MSIPAVSEPTHRVPGIVLALTALLLFAVWSNSFIAIGYLLGAEEAAPRFDWRTLTLARFAVASVAALGYCFAFRRDESLRILREGPRELLLGGLFTVPGYNLALYYGQQHGVPAPIASLTTALAPLFLLVLSALYLGEPVTRRRAGGFVISLAGMAIISQAKEATGTAYPLLVAITAIAPLSWSLFSVVAKPAAARWSPLLFSYLVIGIGTLIVLPFLATATWPRLVALDPAGWGALLYLSLPCSVLGFALWTWLLRHLPASTVGLTVFLNPPLTTLSKFLLSAALPASFAFTINAAEWLGGTVALIGLGVATWRRPPLDRVSKRSRARSQPNTGEVA